MDTNNLFQLFQPYGKVIGVDQFQNRLLHNKFTIVVFYRGNWCEFCGKHLLEFNTIHENVKFFGGTVLAICAQNSELVSKEIREYKLQFDVCSDESNSMAKYYGLNITEKGSELYCRLVQVFKESNPNSNNAFQLELSTNYMNGICQPAVLIFKQGGTVCFQWKGSVLRRTAFGAFDRIQPTYILKIANFLFNEWAQKDNLFVIKNGMERHVFDFILTDKNARELFRKHLQLEYNVELLQFLEYLENVKQSYEDVLKHITFIYNEFVKTDAPKELDCLSSYQDLVARFEKNCQISNPSMIDHNIFSECERIVRLKLSAEPFHRFLSTPNAIEIVKQLPYCFQ